MSDKWLTADATAELLSVCRDHVYTMIRRKQLTVRRMGRAVEISAASVEKRKATNPGPGQPRRVKL